MHLTLALRLYKYLSAAFSLIFWIYAIVDDYGFIQKYGSTHWLEYIGLWLVYYVVYFLTFSFFYWTVSIIVISQIKRVKK